MNDSEPSRMPVEAAENIVRYVSLTGYDPATDTINGNAFERKPKDTDGLSVTRRGVFSASPEDDLRIIRAVSSKWLTIKKSGRFAELNVGEFYEALRAVEADSKDVTVVTDPLEATDEKPANPAHALILGLPIGGEPAGSLTNELVGDVIRKVVRRPLHLAVDPSEG